MMFGFRHPEARRAEGSLGFFGRLRRPQNDAACLRRPQNDAGGFTLIELMLAVSILAIGTVMIQQGFLRASGLFHEASHRLAAQSWMETKLADAREQIVYAEPSSAGSESGTFEIAGRPYQWNLNVDLLPAGKDYYGLTLTVGWSEGGREIVLSKNDSALLRDKMQ